jgi:endonuclease/exonuclease/phosphatase family metal-dependent hydrolase
VETPEGALHLVNTHLGLDERERHWQIDFLLDHELFQFSSVMPTFIAGDFNDWRNTLAEQSLAKHDFQQVTSPPSEYRSFPSWLPVGGLDKVFVRGEVTTERVKVVRTSLARVASDHLPIVVDFSLK